MPPEQDSIDEAIDHPTIQEDLESIVKNHGLSQQKLDIHVLGQEIGSKDSQDRQAHEISNRESQGDSKVVDRWTHPRGFSLWNECQLPPYCDCPQEDGGASIPCHNRWGLQQCLDRGLAPIRIHLVALRSIILRNGGNCWSAHGIFAMYGLVNFQVGTAGLCSCGLQWQTISIASLLIASWTSVGSVVSVAKRCLFKGLRWIWKIRFRSYSEIVWPRKRAVSFWYEDSSERIDDRNVESIKY